MLFFIDRTFSEVYYKKAFVKIPIKGRWLSMDSGPGNSNTILTALMFLPKGNCSLRSSCLDIS